MAIAAIINGSSKWAKRTERELAAFDDIQVWVTKSARDTPKFAQEILETKPDVVILAGGDGTTNQVLNTWMSQKKLPIPAVAILPIGSANDFSRSAGFKNLETLVKHAREKDFSPVDIFQINTNGSKRYCLNICTCGIGANIARTVAKRRGKWPGGLNYFMSTVGWLGIYKTPKVEMMIDDIKLDIRTLLVAIGNGRFAGDGLGLCPQAEINDGKMAVTVIGKIRIFDFLRYLPQLRAVKQINDPRALYRSATELRIRVLDGQFAVEADGEYISNLKKGQFVIVKPIKSALNLVNPF